MNYTLLGKQRTSEEMIIQKIIDRHVLAYLRKFLKAHNTKTGKKYSTKNLQYCTVWKKDKLTKKKKVSRILIKAPLQENFLCIQDIRIDSGITVDDIKAFLDRRGAKKIIFEKPWRSKN